MVKDRKTLAAAQAPTRKSPEQTDKFVGARVRLRRMALGMSQEKLGDAVNLTFQQVQKYEKGTNRIGASRLQQFSQILQVPVEYFFQDLPKFDGGNAQVTPDYVTMALAKTGALRLLHSFNRIQDAKTLGRIVDLVEAISGNDGEVVQLRRAV